MQRKRRILSIIIVSVVAITALVVGGWNWQADTSRSPDRYLAVPQAEKAEQLMVTGPYWHDRVTYPTGAFDPAWVRRAARQDARMASRVPAGSDGPHGASWTSLGPRPERMTGCTGCYDYGFTEGRINAIAVDPTTTSNGSIVAYAATYRRRRLEDDQLLQQQHHLDEHDRRPAASPRSQSTRSRSTPPTTTRSTRAPAT